MVLNTMGWSYLIVSDIELTIIWYCAIYCYFNEFIWIGFIGLASGYLFIILFRMSSPVSNAFEVSFITVSSILCWEQEWPFLCENSCPSNRKLCTSSVYFNFVWFNSLCRYFLSSYFRNPIKLLAYIFNVVHMFFSGSLGIKKPPYFSISSLCKYSKSLYLLSTRLYCSSPCFL